MADVLEELTADVPITVDHVEARIADWERRIASLYEMMKCWAPQEWTVSTYSPVRMHEQMMKKFNLPGRNLPTMILRRADGKSVLVEPRGLWIIGANGRIDVKSNKQYIITDGAENFEKPEWKFSLIINRNDRQDLRESNFRDMLDN